MPAPSDDPSTGPADDELYFRVLGPLTVERHGEPVAVGGPQHAVALALLLCHADQPVPVDGFVAELWRDRPPRSYRVQVQGIISELRRRLAPGGRAAAPIVTRPSAYLLHTAPDGLDLRQFADEVAAAAAARATGDNAAALRLLDVALGRWRGPAFSGLTGRSIEATAATLHEARLDAATELVDARIADGRLNGLVAELGALIGERPLDERLHRHLMTVHDRLGRPADALAAYRDLRARLVRELGIEPAVPTQELHRRILAGEPGPAGPAHVAAAPASAHRQLPPDIADFVGRERELRTLRRWLARDASAGAVPIVVVEGMAGVGKTRFAVHAAHRLAAAYPDGQFYLDLHGFSAESAPAAPGAVLESLLRRLGVPAPAIPESVDDRAVLLRDRLADRRVVLVLDDAADESQVSPLLPATAGCLVIVTSRRALALDGACVVTLDVFSPTEARELLTGMLGRDRVTAEPASVEELAGRCGHLPLAVAVAGRRLRGRPAWRVGHLLARLSDADRGLAEFAVGARGVEDVFALSYRALPPGRQRLFRLLGVHLGDDVTAASTAALVGGDPVDTERDLEALLDEHLVQQVRPGRYELHDLLRRYAARQAAATPDETAAARRRLVDWYVATADRATRLIRRFPLPPVGRPPEPAAPAPGFGDEEAALRWLDAEFVNLRAVIHGAADLPSWRNAVVLAHLLQPYLVRRGQVDDALVTLRAAAAAARHLDDPVAEAHTLTTLGQAYETAGRTDQALECLHDALDRHVRLDQPGGEAATRHHLAMVFRRLGRHEDAIGEYRRAVTLFRALRDGQWEASALSGLSVDLHLAGRDEEALAQALRALSLQRVVGGPGLGSVENNVGLLHARLGRHAEAIPYALRALAFQRRTGSRPGQANALANLAFSYARTGRPADAVRAATEAVELADGLGPDLRANALNTLGEAYRFAGDHRSALRCHREALDIATRIGDAEEQARARAGIDPATMPASA
ncbi:AfsR/SARP family transcriptional regulator [Micromonospora robiginosa]|uniref:Tetratricopeptide repeat protein n=1 Tax=Micromonospora robiginosa TaxID=2749844 RepID=A0A7L6B1M6_9ACTN|nr:BTAD domain-containing putative transcriptional regulator [Micromonospora ferruginea]QLQ35776.1 tetratricopeptide repeat protein [Micromonospora ferruginea]